jgi:ribose-phosphate pyrophosphokinase
MELMFLTDALRRSSAGRITAVVPYFGYARQDRRVRSSRVPISARVVADMLTGVGIDRLLTVDIHAEQIQGFFNIPLDNVYGTPILLDYIRARHLENPIVVSPDVGGVVRARAMAKALNTDLAIIDKRRQKANESEVMNIIGDITDRHCLIVDDIVDTAGTLCKAAQALIEHGADKVSAYCVHPVLSGSAIANIESSLLEELVVTNSIPLHATAAKCKKIKTLSLAPMLSEAIRRTNNEESISLMFCDLI